jgi:lysozyme family protein
MDEYDPAIAFQVLDAAVNHGIETAVRMLQRAAGVADDGHIGPVTVAAIKGKSVTDMLMLFIAQRIKFWTRLSTWPQFGKGWANRAADDLIFAAEDA